MNKWIYTFLFFLIVACNTSPKVSAIQSKHLSKASRGAYKWSKEDQALFIAGCIGTAKGQVGEVKAESYCDCMLNQLQQRFPNMDSAIEAPVDSNELNLLVEECRK